MMPSKEAYCYPPGETLWRPAEVATLCAGLYLEKPSEGPEMLHGLALDRAAYFSCRLSAYIRCEGTASGKEHRAMPLSHERGGALAAQRSNRQEGTR
jgi:hypothetical protein